MAEVWDENDVARYLKLKRWQVLAMARGGAWPAIVVGRSRRFRREDIERWVDEQATRERLGEPLPRQGPQEAVGRKRHRGLDPRGKADPKGALRIYPEGGDRAA